MTRQGRTGQRYITPIDSTGAPLTEEGHGRYTLAAGQTYHYVWSGEDAANQSVHLVGLTAAAIVTSATVRDCDMPVREVANQDTTAGYWVPSAIVGSSVGVEGTGWTATSGVVAVAGGAVGGAFWHIQHSGAARTRLTVVMGGTGGTFIVSGFGKD